MADQERVKVETVDAVGLVTLCGAGTMNAITAAMWSDLAEQLRRLGSDEAVRAVVLTGAGHLAFATDNTEAGDDVEAAREAIEAASRLEKPLVARIRGDCVGAGLVLALAADIRVAAADSAFSITPARARALAAEAALVRACGSAARLLVLTGLRIEAREAGQLGLVDRVVADAELSESVAEVMGQLLDMPADILRESKRALAEA